MENSLFINGVWSKASGKTFSSLDSVTSEVLWIGLEADEKDVNRAVELARKALQSWCSLTPEQRFSYIQKFKTELEKHKQELTLAIASEVGKPEWEAATEVASMIGKVDLSWEAFQKRSGTALISTSGGRSETRYKPHGVVAVFGPYNFPGHLPNGHIVPALIAGNTVVFKPSELTPLIGQKTVEIWDKAGLPAGVINLLQGGRTTGVALAKHTGLDGLFFTGSSQTGLALHRQFAEHPEKMLALEMGGNNPLIVMTVRDKKAAAYTSIQSAYQTSGQRCTCARRLIVPVGKDGDDFLLELKSLISRIKTGHHSERPEPFMGPVITVDAANHILAAYGSLVQQGAVVIVPMKQLRENTALLSPALIDVTGVKNREDKEIFGPLLQVVRVKDFDEAMTEANHTAYGLSAGILCDDKNLFEKFYANCRAGIVNWNRQTTGASGQAPFGGVGLSGNHRPSAYFAADYCSYPIAVNETEKLEMPEKLLPGIIV